MRPRSIVLVVAILLVAGFAALNWSEIVRSTPLLFGPVVVDAPMGLILLALLAITLVLFLVSTAAMRTQSLIDYRHHQKTLDTQRELADKAEASRFHELRDHIDEHLRAVGERDAVAAAEFDKAILESRREMLAQMEQINRTIAARLNELEHRLETRFERMGASRAAAMGDAPVRSEVVPPATVQEQAAAQQAQADEVQRREEGAAAGDRPAESGWRRFF